MFSNVKKELKKNISSKSNEIFISEFRIKGKEKTGVKKMEQGSFQSCTVTGPEAIGTN